MFYVRLALSVREMVWNDGAVVDLPDPTKQRTRTEDRKLLDVTLVAESRRHHTIYNTAAHIPSTATVSSAVPGTNLVTWKPVTK